MAPELWQQLILKDSSWHMPVILKKRCGFIIEKQTN